MTRMDDEPKLVAMANSLRIASPNLVEGIRRFCRDKVQKLLRGRPHVSGVRELQEAVCQELNLNVHEVWSDSDLTEVVRTYISDGDPVFAILPTDLAPTTTFGVLIRRKQNDSAGRLRWAAIVDCRGDKALRRFFTLWHEIAHCLTAVEQYELPLQHRTSIHATAKDPIEKVTDIVAADFAFFDPLFYPILEDEVQAAGRLTFEGIDRVRTSYCPEASWQSTLIACLTRCPKPTLWVEVGLGYKKAEMEALESPQGELLPAPSPIAVLRVADSHRNDAAKALGLLIPKKMRVPESSVISKAFHDGGDWVAQEHLGDWSSKGRSLPAVPIQVEARTGLSGVSAMITVLSKFEGGC